MKRLLFLIALLLGAVSARAAITFDFASEGTGTTTFTWSHAGGANIEGGIVACICEGCTADVFSGAKWGASAMTAVPSGQAIDGTGEPGEVEVYWIGSSVPSGTQTIECTVASGTDPKHAIAIGVQAAGDVQLAGTACTVTADATDPSCTVSTITGARFGFAFLFSGLNTEAATAGAGFTLGPSHDFGTKSTASEYETTQGTGNLTAAFTAAVDDVAMVGLALEQVTPDAVAGKRRSPVVFE